MDLSAYVSVLAVVVAIISLVIALYAISSARFAVAQALWLFKEYKKVVENLVSLSDIVASKPAVTMHTFHEVPSEKKAE